MSCDNYSIDSVNSAHDSLVDEINLSHVEIGRLLQENEQLREALKKCNPYEAYTPEGCSIWMPCCKFCRHISPPDLTLEESMKFHKDDCEYIRLIGEVENE